MFEKIILLFLLINSFALSPQAARAEMNLATTAAPDSLGKLVQAQLSTSLAQTFSFIADPFVRNAFIKELNSKKFTLILPVVANRDAGHFEVRLKDRHISFRVGLEGNRLMIGDHLVTLSSRLGNLSEKLREDFDGVRLATAQYLLETEADGKKHFIKNALGIRRLASIIEHGPLSAWKSKLQESEFETEVANAAWTIELSSLFYEDQSAFTDRVWNHVCDQGKNLNFDWDFDTESQARKKIALVEAEVTRSYFYELAVQHVNLAMSEWTRFECADSRKTLLTSQQLMESCDTLEKQQSCFERILTSIPKLLRRVAASDQENWRVEQFGSNRPWTLIFDE